MNCWVFSLWITYLDSNFFIYLSIVLSLVFGIRWFLKMTLCWCAIRCEILNKSAKFGVYFFLVLLFLLSFITHVKTNFGNIFLIKQFSELNIYLNYFCISISYVGREQQFHFWQCEKIFLHESRASIKDLPNYGSIVFVTALFYASKLILMVK